MDTCISPSLVKRICFITPYLFTTLNDTGVEETPVSSHTRIQPFCTHIFEIKRYPTISP